MNINYLKRIAGIPLNEGYDDDDEDRDAKIAASDRRQQEFERRNKRTVDGAAKKAETADRKAEDRGAKRAAKDDDLKDDSKPKKKEAAPAGKKYRETDKSQSDRGYKPGKKKEKKAEFKDDSGAPKAKRARAWLNHHANATRAEFMAFARNTCGLGTAHASTMYQSHKSKRKLSEAFYVANASNLMEVMAVTSAYDRATWDNVSLDGSKAKMFESLESAENAAKKMAKFGHMVRILTAEAFAGADLENEDEITFGEDPTGEDEDEFVFGAEQGGDTVSDAFGGDEDGEGGDDVGAAIAELEALAAEIQGHIADLRAGLGVDGDEDALGDEGAAGADPTANDVTAAVCADGDDCADDVTPPAEKKPAFEGASFCFKCAKVACGCDAPLTVESKLPDLVKAAVSAKTAAKK